MGDMNIPDKLINLLGLKSGLKKSDMQTQAQKSLFDKINTNATDDEIDENELSEFGKNFDTDKGKELSDEQIAKYLKDNNLHDVKVQDFKDFVQVWSEKSTTQNVSKPAAQNNSVQSQSTSAKEPQDDFDKFLDELKNDKKGTYKKLLELFDYNNDGILGGDFYKNEYNHVIDEKDNLKQLFKEITGTDELPSKKILKRFAKILENMDEKEFDTYKKYSGYGGYLKEYIATELGVNKSNQKIRDIKKEQNVANKHDKLDIKQEDAPLVLDLNPDNKEIHEEMPQQDDISADTAEVKQKKEEFLKNAKMKLMEL